MALYLKQNETRSQLQERLAKELQDRAKQRAQLQDRPDGVVDTAYIKGTKQTTSLAWVWALIALAVVGLIIFLIVASL